LNEEAVRLYDAGDNCALGTSGFQYTIPGNGDLFEFGTVVKYIEANGKPQGIEPMAGSGQPGSPAGDGSDSVDWQLWGQGDLLVCSELDPASCTCCRVPPPPK
jgi:hypothetical protein